MATYKQLIKHMQTLEKGLPADGGSNNNVKTNPEHGKVVATSDELKSTHLNGYNIKPLQASEKTFSEEEVVEMLKNFISDKAVENSDVDMEDLENGMMNAFKNGISLLGLIHGAHYITSGNDQKAPSAISQEAQVRGPSSVQPDSYIPKDSLSTGKSSYKDDKISNFLKAISLNESSGGQNLNHPTMNSGIHKGDSAVGKYGLMPNTIKETVGRMGRSHPLNKKYASMDNSKMADEINQNPEHEKEITTHLANRLHDKFAGDTNKMAYAWNQGHNLTSDHFENEHKDYKNHDYVKKFNENSSNLEKNPKLNRQLAGKPDL